MRWRPTLLVLHRDLGFFALGLTLVYGISGIAVNHRHDWDYNYSNARESVTVGTAAQLLPSLSPERRDQVAKQPSSITDQEQAQLVRAISTKLQRSSEPSNVFWRGPNRISIFYATGEADVVDYNPVTGVAEHLAKRPRPLLRQLNFLHLNEAHGLWTYVADAYAAVLIFLAVSGVAVVQGRKGLLGRGGAYALAGVLLPIAAYLLLARG